MRHSVECIIIINDCAAFRTSGFVLLASPSIDFSSKTQKGQTEEKNSSRTSVKAIDLTRSMVKVVLFNVSFLGEIIASRICSRAGI